MRKFDPPSISPSQRAKEYPGEHLVQSGSKLFCQACREDLAVKSSVVKNHVSLNKHQTSKEKLKEKVAKERDIAEALHARDRETQTLPEEQDVYHARVVMAFMKSGIPLSKLDCPELRGLLEEKLMATG